MTISEQQGTGVRGRDFGSGPCPACDASFAVGELCATHRAMIERDIPTPLVKLSAPKPPSTGPCFGCRHPDTSSGHCLGTGDLEPTEGLWPGFICNCPCRDEAGHTAPDFLWTIALILAIVVMLRMLGAL